MRAISVAVLLIGERPMKCLQFDSDENEYRLVEAASNAAFPFKNSFRAYSICTFVPEYGVIMWAEAKGVFLYKHDPSASYPVAAATPPAAGEKNEKAEKGEEKQ